MNEEYYVLEDGEKTGPFAFNELITRGIDIDTPVLTPGADEWQNASYIPEFIEYFETQGHYFPTEENIAGFGWRTLAFFIDYMIISFIAAMIDIKAGLLVLPTSPVLDPLAFYTSLSQKTMLMLEASIALVFLIYNVLFEATGFRGSIGKKLCGLKVVDQDGMKLSVLTAFLRNVCALTVYYPLGTIFLIISFFTGNRRQTWYERLVKVYVIRVEQ